MDSPLNPTPLSGRSKSWWLGQVALGVLLWASLVQLPISPSVALDTSWQMVLDFAASHGLQHGVDLTFTFGPLGYLSVPCYTGNLFDRYILWQILSNALIAAGLYRFGRGLTSWRQAVYYLYILCFGAGYPDAVQMMCIAVFALMLTRREYRRTGWIISIASAFAIFSLIKFTNLLLCSFIVTVLGGYYLAIRNPRQSVLLLGSFAVVFLASWLVCGQSLGNIPAALFYGLQLSLGYVGAMGNDATVLSLWLGLSAIASVAVYLGLYLLTTSDRLKAGCSALILGALVFINWKHGFIRAETHAFAHYLTVLMVACTYPALLEDNLRAAVYKQLALGVGLIASLIGLAQYNALDAPHEWNARLRKTVTALLDLPYYHRVLDHGVQTAANAAVMPKIHEFVGQETVDHLGDDQGFTLLNRLNYTPRPAVQGYTAYTDALNRLDESFYRSARAPRFAIQRFRSVDGRLTALDDSLTQKLIYQNYDYVLEEAGLILWERPQKISPNDPAQEKIVFKQTVRFGETIAVPDVGDQPVWAVIRIAQSIPGKIRQLLYKPPLLTLNLEDDQAVKHEFRFVREMGASGFILQPFFPDSNGLIAYQTGRPARKIRTLSLHSPSSGESYYTDEIQIELRTIAPFKRAVDGLKPDAPHRFRMMNRVPESLSAGNPAIDAFVEGEHLLQMHPSSVMTFAIDQPINLLTASFGLMPGAEGGAVGTLGVAFIVEWHQADGRTERLYSRFLDPRNHTEDRGRQTLKIDLGQRQNGKLLLRTEPGPSGNKSYCWSYWTGIEIK